MPYDTATQAQEPVMLDGAELKIGDEVIIARQPADPSNDTLWVAPMARLVGQRGIVVRVSASRIDRREYQRIYSDNIVSVDVGNPASSWWFRVSELVRPRTYHQAANDAPTEFPNLVAFNETMGPGPLHPACRTSSFCPYNPEFLVNERRLCPYDDLRPGYDDLRPGYDAYRTQQEFERAQAARRDRFYVWRDEREYRRDKFLRRIHKQLATHPFAGTKKGGISWRDLRAFDRSYYTETFKQQNRDGRASAKIIGRLVGHFHPAPHKQRPLPDDEVFALLRSTLSHNLQFQARDALEARADQAGAAYRAYIAARRKIYSTGEWRQVPWNTQGWFVENDAADNRLTHISVVNPQEVAYYQSVDKLIRGIETRTKPGRFLAKFFPNLTPDQVRQYANDYLVATAPKQLHIARTMEDIITAIDEGPSESCQTRGYYDKSPDARPWFDGHIHPAACYASGDFEVAYITDNNQPASIKDLHAGDQRITARAICNATNKTVARIYGDSAKLLPLLTSAGYTQVGWALVGCRLLKIENENDSGWIMPYVDGGIGSGGGSLDVDDYYDYDSGKSYWMLVRSGTGEHNTYAGYNDRGVLKGEEGRTCPRCGATHDDEDDIHYSDYEEVHYCSECDGDFVSAVVNTARYGRDYGRDYDMVLIDNAIELDGDWYANDDDLLERCGFVQCIHCDEWTSLGNTTTTDSGQVCCQHQVVELAEESPDGNKCGYRPDCTQYVNTETGETVWLDDNADADEFTTADNNDNEVPLYVSLDEWGRMQDERDRLEAQPTFEVQGQLPRAAPVMPRLSEPVFDDLRI